MHGGPNPNAAAPAWLRPILDGIDMLSRLDGWLGAACLVSLTSLMIAEVVLRARSTLAVDDARTMARTGRFWPRFRR